MVWRGKIEELGGEASAFKSWRSREIGIIGGFKSSEVGVCPSSRVPVGGTTEAALDAREGIDPLVGILRQKNQRE